MAESLKITTPTRATPEDKERAFLEHLESVADVIKALGDTCPTTAELAETVHAGIVVPGVLRMIMDKVANSRPR